MIAKIQGPLTSMTSEKAEWKWGPEQIIAFNDIKELLLNAPALTVPDYNLPFILYTDACDTGIGAVLTQQGPEREYHITAISRSLNIHERNYTTTEKECLAVIWAYQKLRGCYEEYPVTVVTDHGSLKWLQNVKNPRGRLARWVAEYSLWKVTIVHIVHRPGVNNEAADAFSRVYEDIEPEEETLNRIKDIRQQWYDRKLTEVKATPERFPQWKIVDGALYYYRPRHPNQFFSDAPENWKEVI